PPRNRCSTASTTTTGSACSRISASLSARMRRSSPGETSSPEAFASRMARRLRRGFRRRCPGGARRLPHHRRWPPPPFTPRRAALGLALAVLVARLFGLDRAFWVVLGTMSVLRSNALATGRTTVQALAGTLLGFAVGGLFALLFAHDPVVLWAALPSAVFLAAYAPSALSFVGGQAAFTVMMLIFFNLLTPVGWRVGLVRIEDVAVGSAIGVAAG